MISTPTTYLTRGQVVSYSLGDVANNVAFQMTSLFLMAYMTDIAGVPAAMAGTIYAVTKIWAGFTDLFAGNSVGRRETKHGRLRPWIIWVSPFLAASLVLLFSTPAGLTGTAAFAWILLFDAAFQLCYSFVNIPYGSLSAALTQNAVDRSRLAGSRSIASAVTGVALSFVLAPQFRDTQADGIRLKFTIATLALSAVALFLYWLCFRGTREVVPGSANKITLRSTFSMVGKNRPLLVLCTGAFFLLCAAFTMNAVMMYYARNVLGDANYLTYLMLAQTIGTIAVASAVPAITVRFGKRTGYVVLALVAVMGFALMGVVPTGSGGLPLALGAFFVYGLGFGGTNALMFSMQADTVDYGEWKTGTRAEGGAYSVLSFVRKCGQGAGGAIGGAIVAAFGYVGGSKTQTAEAIQGIKLATGFAPAALCVVAALILLFYPLKAEQHSSLVTELTRRRAQRAAQELAGVPAGAPLVAGGPVVTVNEEYGAGGAYVASQVAQRLGVPYTGQRFSSHELEVADTLEPVTGHPADGGDHGEVSAFLRSLSRTGVATDSAVAADAESDTAIVRGNIADLVAAVTPGGGVVLGRDATVALAPMQDAVHVRLVAPVATRVARAATESGISQQVAAERQVREDRMRTAMSRRLMHWDATDRAAYGLVIDTGEVTLDEAVDQVVAAVRERRR